MARRLAVVAAILLVAPACRQRVDGNALSDQAACSALDSLLATAGPGARSMSGEAVIDVDQFRFRGRFRLDTTTAGDAVIELGGSTLFGGHREDVVVSLAADTLRVFDRERGRLYEGETVDDLIWDGTRAHADWTRVVADVLAAPVRCEGFRDVVLDGDGARGALARGPFRIVTEGGRVTRATWPDPIEGSNFDDQLEVRYAWRGAELAEITAILPTRGWRVRLRATK